MCSTARVPYIRYDIKINPLLVYPTKTVRLLLETERLYDARVLFLVARLKVFEMRAAVRNHLEEAAATVLVLKVLLEVGGKLVDFLSEERNLNRCRSGIGIMLLSGLNHAGLLGLCQHGQTVARFFVVCNLPKG